MGKRRPPAPRGYDPGGFRFPGRGAWYERPSRNDAAQPQHGHVARDCLQIGLTARDATITGQSALLARARDTLRTVEVELTRAIADEDERQREAVALDG